MEAVRPVTGGSAAKAPHRGKDTAAAREVPKPHDGRT